MAGTRPTRSVPARPIKAKSGENRGFGRWLLESGLDSLTLGYASPRSFFAVAPDSWPGNPAIGQRLLMGEYLARGSAETLHLVIPNDKGEDFVALPKALREMQALLQEQGRDADLTGYGSTMEFQSMLIAYARDDHKQFNNYLQDYQKRARTVVPQQVKTASVESSFNARSVRPQQLFFQSTLMPS